MGVLKFFFFFWMSLVGEGRGFLKGKKKGRKGIEKRWDRQSSRPKKVLPLARRCRASPRSPRDRGQRRDRPWRWRTKADRHHHQPLKRQRKHFHRRRRRHLLLCASQEERASGESEERMLAESQEESELLLLEQESRRSSTRRRREKIGRGSSSIGFG